MHTLSSGTEIVTRGLHWQIVLSQNLGAYTLYRSRGIDGILAPDVTGVAHGMIS